jgi:hypothetical protein
MDKLMLLIAILLITNCTIIQNNSGGSYAQPEPFEPSNNFYGLVVARILGSLSLVHTGDEWSSDSFAEGPWNCCEY